MFGMALATSISYLVAVVVGCCHFIRRYNTLKLTAVKGLGRELASMVATGAPTAISRICDTVKVMVLNNLMVAVVGAGAVTALNVRTQASNIVGALIVGIGQATIPVAGMFYGEEDRTALKDTLKTSLRVGMILCAAGALALLLFPGSFIGIFGVTDPAIMDMSTAAIRLFAVGMPIALLNTIMMNFYQSTGRTGLATAICVLQSLVFTAAAAFLLIRPFRSTGVWTAFLLGEVSTLLTVVVYVSIKNRAFSLDLSSYMLLGSDFGGSPKDRLELSIGNSMEEVMAISSGIFRLGESRDIDKKILNEISLCIEEMAGNVVRHAFKPGEKKWFDVLILRKPGSVIIRMRDNGAAFDPSNYLDTASGADGRETFGIKMIASIADRFEYSRNMGLNVLLIVLDKPDGR